MMEEYDSFFLGSCNSAPTPHGITSLPLPLCAAKKEKGPLQDPFSYTARRWPKGIRVSRCHCGAPGEQSPSGFR